MQGNVNIPDSTITSALTFRQLVLMNMQQLTNFPYIEKDFDALTDYELLCLVVKYLNDVIANQNEQNDSITSMYESFLDLQTYVNNTKDTLEEAFNNLDDYVRNYFDNLDVQEEINNKLDQMLEDGVLEQIIEQFLQSSALWCFDTINGMKTATNLTNGSYAKTLGYYNANDGGKGLYKIRTKTNNDVINEGSLVALNDVTLVAELIEDEKGIINVLQWGVYSDGLTDNSTIFNKIIDYCNTNRYNIFIPKGNYVIEDDLHDIVSPISIYGNVSGSGQFELKSTIIDKRTSTNYLFNINSKSTIEYTNQGGIIKYLNFRNLQNEYKNKCINLVNTQCYQGVISNCNFYQYGICIYMDRTHGLSLDKCSFVKCGSDTANSTDYAIIIENAVDVSISNCMIDHTRFQLKVDTQSYVYVTGTHFEMSTLNVVTGNSPIHCNTGLFGHVMFANCSFIGLSYKYWAETLNVNPATVPFMIYGTYIDIDNCILSCGSGSGSYHTNYAHQCKFANMYYGTISNCKIKRPSYLINSFTLTQAKMVNSHIQCDIELDDYSSIQRNSRIIYSNTNKSKDNYLQFIIPTTDPQTYPTIYPVLYYLHSDMTPIETNKGEILYTPVKQYATLQEYNTFRIQSNTVLSGLYRLKVYSTGQTSLIYEGYFRIANKVLVKVSDIYKSFGEGYGLKIFSDDDSNDLYIQFIMSTYRTNTLIFELEGLEGHPDVIGYYIPSINQELTFSNVLDLKV